MRLRPSRVVRLLCGAVVMLGLCAAPAAAQQKKDDKPFQEPGLVFADSTMGYIQWLAGVLLVVAVTVVAIKNPHRSHLD